MIDVLIYLFGATKLFVAFYILTLLTWLFYIAIMHLRLVRDRLHPFAKVNAYILLFFGLLLDVAVNVLVGTVVFADLPREWLLTERLKRMKREGKWWQRMTAYWICEHLLNQFDEGHC
jgi:hypothetical protein